MHVVTFFTRPDCSLCDAALYVARRVGTQIPFDLRIVDISAPGNEKWLNAYRDDIPVLHLNGAEVFRHRVDEHRFRKLLDEVDSEV